MEEHTTQLNKTMAAGPRPGISAYTLKMIALVTMFIDHVGAAVLMNLVWGGYLLGDSRVLWGKVYYVSRAIGRLSFPIYCFLIVEGFLHTRNVKKYALRLFLFALISEIPFDLAFEDAVLEFSYQNVFFTLLLGLLAIWGMEEAQKRIREGMSLVQGKFMMCACLMVCVLTAEFLLKADYGACGVMTIALIYMLRRKSKTLAFALAVLFLGIVLNYTEFWALVMVPFVYLYDGSKGRAANKYLFYGFYPAHLLFLAGACRYLEGLLL